MVIVSFEAGVTSWCALDDWFSEVASTGAYAFSEPSDLLTSILGRVTGHVSSMNQHQHRVGVAMIYTTLLYHDFGSWLEGEFNVRPAVYWHMSWDSAQPPSEVDESDPTIGMVWRSAKPHEVDRWYD